MYSFFIIATLLETTFQLLLSLFNEQFMFEIEWLRLMNRKRTFTPFPPFSKIKEIQSPTSAPPLTSPLFSHYVIHDGFHHQKNFLSITPSGPKIIIINRKKKQIFQIKCLKNVFEKKNFYYCILKMVSLKKEKQKSFESYKH